MSEPRFSINFTGEMLATDDPCAVGDALVYDTAEGVWRVANAANRAAANARAGAIALTDWGGSAVGKVSYQSSGILAEEISELGAGSASWVRVSAAGRLERCTPAPGDDLVGRCDADGRVHLQMGTWDSTNYAGGGGGSVTFSGDLSGVAAGPQVVERIKGTTVTTAGGALPVGAVLRTTAVGTADWGALDLADNDARTGVLPTANGGTGLSSAGSDGNVLTASGGVWVSSAPGSGAPSNAQYLTLATNASLSNERVFTPSTGLSAVDGGANGNYTLSCTFTPSSTDTLTNKTFNIISNTLTSTAVGQLLKGVSGGVYDHFARGTALQVLRVNAAGTDLEWATLGSGLTVAGSSGDLQTNNGAGALGAIGGSNGTFLCRISGAWTADNRASSYNASSGAASDGLLRAANNTKIACFLNQAGSANVTALASSTANDLYVGSNASDAERANGIRYNAASFHYMSIAGSFYLVMEASKIQARQSLEVGVNLAGCSDLSTPLVLKKASIAMSGSTDVTLTAAQYSCPFLYASGSVSGPPNIIAPDTEGAIFVVSNDCNGAIRVGTTGTNGTADIAAEDTVWVIRTAAATDYTII